MADATNITIAPKRSRRSVLKLAGSAVVAGYVTGQVVSGGDPNPFSTLVQKYRDGLKAFLAIPEDVVERNEDAYAASTYLPYFNAIIDDWRAPFQSKADAIAAIRFAADDNDAGSIPGAKERLTELAVAYFENA